jgi:predicted nucleic acid-binding Zn ribbon protein
VVNKLADILGQMETGVAKSVQLCGFLALWDEVVDERVLKNAKAIKISNRTLYVSTSSSTWAHELTFLKRDIIKKFNERAGKEVIRDIRFSNQGYSG